MRTRKLARNLGVLLVAICLGAPAIAGGPLSLYDPATRTAHVWPDGNTPVYLDLGPMGPASNEEADGMMAFSIDQWNAVPSSSFGAVVAGDFGAIGLPDIDATNIFDVLGAWNGGGIHVVYDADGSIHELLFGFSGVLGFTVIEWVDEDSATILEATIVLNGSSLFSNSASDLAGYAGVATHEFGHAINLAHSQTNGQVLGFFEAYVGPEGCTDPYSNFPSANDVETMYPFINLFQTGAAMSTVDRLDDIAVLSDLYPADGWPGSHGTIEGTVRVRRNGPHTTEFTGANVIARNVTNPFGDAISAISGDYSQGLDGPDGAYAFHGLTPGASYYVYLDGIWAGAFSTPYPTVLPGPEEYYNGALESGDGITDDRCDYTTVEPAAGIAVMADMTFNRVKGAPSFRSIDLPVSWIADLSQDGRTAVGTWGGGLFRWTAEADWELIGGTPYSPSPGISEDGMTIVGEIVDSTTFGKDVNVASVWQGGETWAPIGLVPGNQPCDASLISAWDVSDNGRVVGLSWRDCVDVTAYEWTADEGIHELGYMGDSTHPGSRANTVSADGTVVIGWDKEGTGFWRGARWDNGVESLITLPTPEICDTDPSSPWYYQSSVGTAYGMNADASAITGEGYPVPVEFDFGGGQVFRYCESDGWLWTASDGIRHLGAFQYQGFRTSGSDVSNDGSVVVGVALPSSPWDPRRPMLWTETTGPIDFQEFLAVQGTWAPNWVLQAVTSISGDGTIAAGGAYSPYDIQGFVVEMPKVVMCHHTPGKKQSAPRKNTIDVAFPGGMDEHLAHGDTIGLCGNGM